MQRNRQIPLKGTKLTMGHMHNQVKVVSYFQRLETIGQHMSSGLNLQELSSAE